MAIRLEPRRSRRPDRRWRRGSAGSLIEADGGRLTYTGPSAFPEWGWSCAIGAGPGQAAAIVRVSGTMSHGIEEPPITVDHYAVVDSAGHPLGHGIPSGRDSSTDGWFPAPAVRTFAEQAGLPYSETDFDSAADLQHRFPGLVEHIRGSMWSERLAPVTLFGVALVFLVPGIAGLTANPYWVSMLLLIPGLFQLGLAVAMLPPIRSRLRHRHLWLAR